MTIKGGNFYVTFLVFNQPERCRQGFLSADWEKKCVQREVRFIYRIFMEENASDAYFLLI